MLNAARALSLASESGRELPRVDAFRALYAWGFAPRHGQVVMVAGRSGSQKSGFVMFWCDEMNLRTLYFAGDMSPFDASMRIANKRTGRTKEVVEDELGDPVKAQEIYELTDESRIRFSFGPITLDRIVEELDVELEAYGSFPPVIVVDNFMDMEGATSEYGEQMAAMQFLVDEVARYTGSTVLVLHHATDKSWDAKTDPWSPPARSEIKGGMSEKPEAVLTVALDSSSATSDGLLDFNVAVVKQRTGKNDPTGKSWVTLKCLPALTRFYPANSFN